MSSSSSRSPGTPDRETGRHRVTDLLELNALFTAWVETVYHRRPHGETGTAPLTRWAAGGPFVLPSPAALAEAFLWEERRRVTKTATLSLHGNTYAVDPLLAGHQVALVFDPFDLTHIEVRAGGVPAGTAIPHRIGRHAHPKARPEIPPAPAAPTGIDYAAMIAAAHHGELGRGVNYQALTATATKTTPSEATGTEPPGSSELPGQLDLLIDPGAAAVVSS